MAHQPTQPIGNISKSLGEVYCRLFDHRPSVNGEINYFIKEFEGRRGNREYERLISSHQYTTNIADHLEDAGNLQLQTYLPNIQKQMNQALEAATRIQENQSKPERNVWLEEQRQERVEEWSQFMNTMCEKSGNVDREVDEELRRVGNYYKEMENKLNILDTNASSST